jgi:uracil-DNA glycosylase family 4
MSRREDFLREMGLAPVWRLRDRPAQVPAVHAIANLVEDRAVQIAKMHWPELRSAVAQCSACSLCKARKNTVFGVGDESADWMIVGEAPGAEEDERGEPFVGQAGRLLDSMLASIGLSRGKDASANVYIANVLKCRPPGNRNPEPVEVAQCTPYLMRQIELVQPKLIVAMGRFAAQTLLNSDASIASMRGRAFRCHGVPTVVTYHPAYLLRNLPDKAKAWEDLCFARRAIATAQA